jgi:hypothetical protein
MTTGPTGMNPAGPGSTGTIALESAESCVAEQACVDGYLWSLYERTPKVDTVKVAGTEKVTVKRKGKPTTVTKTTSTLVGEDFTWKDPKAAEVAAMSTMDYVIGGMDAGFRGTLYRALRALDDAGFKPGITCAFRDDYRQSIATGLKARNDRSYHGGSFRGGYGHGVAADIVSVRGETREERLASSQQMWDWIEAHEIELGIGRPYRDRDPPHVGPLDGQEYAEHRLVPADARAEPKARTRRSDNRSEKKNDKRSEKTNDKKSEERLDAHGDHGIAKRAAMTKPAKASERLDAHGDHGIAKRAAMTKPAKASERLDARGDHAIAKRAAATKPAKASERLDAHGDHAVAKRATTTKPAKASSKPRTHAI